MSYQLNQNFWHETFVITVLSLAAETQILKSHFHGNVIARTVFKFLALFQIRLKDCQMFEIRFIA